MRISKTTRAALTMPLAAVLLLCVCIGGARAQENAQLQIPPSLVECYNTSYFMNRDNRLPMSIESLITIIEKVENSYGFNMDIRQLSVALLHRFRQDGIQRAAGVLASPGVLPYSPTGFQFPKFRILLSRLIPGNALNFPNNTLSREERCSLHFMLSSSFDTRERGDENQVCNQLAEYRAQRIPRATPNQIKTNFMGDVEILENVQNRIRNRGAPQSGAQVRSGYNANGRTAPVYSDVDVGWETGYGYSSTPNSVSQCPVENGVIRTQWGTVAAGNLIAGIAAGLQPQIVQLRTLLALSRRPGAPNMPQTATVNVDNRWAATLAGDLAEVALVQVPVTTTETATVGAKGGWNSTVMPKWYFLQQRQNLEMTDAEIRGGLDGLIIAMNIANWRTQAPSMTLSQLLRMYYSTDGVLGSGIMACNRQDNFATVAPLSQLIPQTSAFAQVLDREMQLHVTLSPEAIAQFSASAANALAAYIPQYMTDMSCLVSNALPQGISSSITAMTNLYVFLDTSWQYSTVVDYVNYILQRLNINPYASTVTMVAAADGSLIVNRTHYLSDVYAKWNVSTHQTFVPGFNLPVVLRTVQNLTQSLMDEQKTNNSVGGHSLVALLIPNMAMINEGDSSYSTTQLQYLSEQVPDLRFIYYGGGSINRFASFVLNPSTDLFSLSMGSQVSTSSEPVVQAIKKIPRRLINPRCGHNWYTTTWGTDQLVQYLRPGDINFYRMAPNYFYKAGGNRNVNIQSQNSLQFTICSSRSIVLPQQNATTGIINANSNDQTCVQITGNSYSYDLSNACNGYSTIHQCPPLYLSVQAPQPSPIGGGGGGIQTVSCSDAACQSPDQARYIVSVSNLDCYSGVSALISSFLTVSLAFVFIHLMK